MNPFDTTDYSYAPPPPAYTEQEFDQKVSIAVDLSHQAYSALSLQDEWEPYDPAAFEAASAGYNQQQQHLNVHASGSSAARPSTSRSTSPIPTHTQNKAQDSKAPSTQPLRIHKKNGPSQDAKSEKDRVRLKWEAADQQQQAGSAGASSSSAAPQPSQPYNEHDGDDIAPPPFAELPPEHFELQPQGFDDRVHSEPQPIVHRPPPVFEVQVQAAPPLASEHPVASIPPTPVESYHAPPTPQPTLNVTTDHVANYQRQSMPPPSATGPPMHRPMGERRPYSEIGPPSPVNQFPQRAAPTKSYSSMGSMLQFNPSVAYNKTASHRQPHPSIMAAMRQEEPPPGPFNAAAFYNNAIASHMQTPVRNTARLNAYPGSNNAGNMGYEQPQPQYGNMNMNVNTNTNMNYNSNANQGGFNPPGVMQSWGNRPMSTYTMESSYSGDVQYGGGPMNRFTASPGPPAHQYNQYNQWHR